MILNTNYNPDVLTCLANLSNDEVFTPPQVVNRMLDMLPAELFRSKETKFLDPVSKSGVFLREIAKRLMIGLESQIPDIHERADHIFTKQLFGIAITELTALTSRRSVYCSKRANGQYSICRKFHDEEGNLRYRAIEHKFVDGKCKYCGASESVFGKKARTDLESHAYEFIHTDKPEKIFGNMKFDVIIGNPPYQLEDGGGMGSSAIPIYQKFVTQAQKLNPRFLTMIIPSRWFTGGRGLDDFRDRMLNDKRISILHDYVNASECFPGVEIKGGVCYFLWEKDRNGLCKVYTHSGDRTTESNRYLLEEGSSIFIRNIETINVIHKVQQKEEASFSTIVSANDPFGYDVRVANSYKRIKPKYDLKPSADSVKFYYNGWKKNGIGYISASSVSKNNDWIKKPKILIPKAWGNGDPATGWLNPIIADDNSVCTETYLVVGPFETETEAENAVSYIQTRFFHLLVSAVKITQNTMQKAYTFVPLQDFSHPWTDEMLYEKYGLTDDEIAFIESMIRPME